MAATRYAHGDDFTDADVDALRRRPRRPESGAFADALRARDGRHGSTVCPASRWTIENPTTVGLGDTFVGGFLAAVATTEAT